jgi:phospholipid/cholesterol/gamma-HCH transport system substrate-binding protein
MRRRNEVLVGLLTTAGLAILIMGTLWLVRGGLQRGYPVYARFEWGAGLKQGQPVLFSGVNVGYVDRVDLLDNGGLVTTLRIYKSQHVPIGTTASIVPNGIFGDVAIALRAAAPTSERLSPGDTIPSAPGGTSLSNVVSRVDSVAQNLVRLTAALHREVVDERSIAELRTTTRAAREMFEGIERAVVAQSAELTRTNESLRRAAGGIDSAQIDSVVRGFRDATDNLNRLMDDLRATGSQLDSALAKVNSGEGTLGKLFTDPNLYAEARALVRQMDSLLVDIKANPRKYIRFSVF